MAKKSAKSARGAKSAKSAKGARSTKSSRGASSRGSAKKTSRASAGSRKSSGGRGRSNAAFMAPVTPSAELGAVVGGDPKPRTEITKRLWEYIKKNGLQDQKNRRMIKADANLKAVFGGKSQVNMFEMTSLVNKHVK